MFNLKNATVLTRAQQKNVKGGNASQACRFTVIDHEGVHRVSMEGFSDGAEGFREARALCNEAASMNMHTRCFFDCEYDGFGR